MVPILNESGHVLHLPPAHWRLSSVRRIASHQTTNVGFWIGWRLGSSSARAGSAVAKLAKRDIAVRPPALHLHPELEVHAPVEERLHGVPRLGAYALERRALFADDECLVTFPVDIDGRRYRPQ